MNKVEQQVALKSLSAQLRLRVPRLRPQDELLKVSVSDDEAAVLIRRVEMRELVTRTEYKSARLELHSWVRDEDDGKWYSMGEAIITADRDFRPYADVHKGRIWTEEERREQLAFESECGRPGNGTRFGQRDTFHRAWDGYDHEPNVRNTWREHQELFSHYGNDE